LLLVHYPCILYNESICTLRSGEFPMPRNLSKFYAIVAFIVLITLACTVALPFASPAATPTAVPPTATALPNLPPAVAEVQPAPGAWIGLTEPITLYFNQPMNKTSVESAIRADLATGFTFNWRDDSTLILTPTAPLPAETNFTLTLESAAQAVNGLSLEQPLSLNYRTADALRVTQVLPQPNAQDVSPLSAVVVAFNQPMVALGAEADAPAAFRLQPEARGRGEWLNTSTYIFYPEPGLGGGGQYTIQIDPTLTSTAGSFLGESELQAWTFSTALPRIDSFTTFSDGQSNIALDSSFVIVFNQPMDKTSVEQAFSIAANGAAVRGAFEWDKTGAMVTFKPSGLLARNTEYTLSLSTQARGYNGVNLPGGAQKTLRTMANFAVTGAEPRGGVQQNTYDPVRVLFTSPPAEGQPLEQYIRITPPTDYLWVYGGYDNNASLALEAGWKPNQTYTIQVSGEMPDKWGQKLGQDYTFTVRTAQAQPALNLPYLNDYSFFLRPNEPFMDVQAAQLEQVYVTRAALALETFFRMTGSNSYDARQYYDPSNQVFDLVTLEPVEGRPQTYRVPLGLGASQLTPGMYFFRVTSSQLAFQPSPFVAVVSNLNVLLKSSERDALVWVTDLNSGQPLANAPVRVYAANGTEVTSGFTDANGLWQSAVNVSPENPIRYALVGEPNTALFGLAAPNWNTGIAPWNFGMPYDNNEPRFVYVYSERGIYRPGQTVYFRGLARESYYGVYDMPAVREVTVQIASFDTNELLYEQTLPLSAYGTFNGEFTLPEGVRPGGYDLRVSAPEPIAWNQFLVAEYRKPEIELTVAAQPEQILAGAALNVTAQANYYFGAPAGGVPVTWRAYSQPAWFGRDGYIVGAYDSRWAGFDAEYSNFGYFYYEGQAITAPDGSLALDLPVDTSKLRTGQIQVEITATDETGLPVSGRTTVTVHPEVFYIGIQPNSWLGRAGQEMAFNLATFDWDENPVNSLDLRVVFNSVSWERSTSAWGVMFAPVYTPLEEKSVRVDANGNARVAFTPAKSGTYMLSVTSGNARSEVMLWVSGTDQAQWLDLPEQRLQLTADRETYAVGETAQVFIPNPFNAPATALVSVERGRIFATQFAQIPPGGQSVSIPISANSYSPNVVVAVTLFGAGNQFRQGYINLDVPPTAFTLQVDVNATPAQSEPGGEVTLDVRVRDSQGRGVQGEFSLAVVDLAVLALADSNAAPIVPAFYHHFGAGVNTVFSLAASPTRFMNEPPGGRGGGGGDGLNAVIREDFPDTAYWTATLVTDASGNGQVRLRLPDSLTTWHVDVRGISTDHRVGEGQTTFLVSKPLIVRPVTPRFFVVGDVVELAAVVQNLTDSPLQATVKVQASGFSLSDPARATQQVNIPANGRTRVVWRGVAESSPQVELIFSASAPAVISGQNVTLTDVTRPASGFIPVLRYVSPQTFRTAGLISTPTTVRELLSLPRSFPVTGGDLTLELAPSLASAVLQDVKSLTPPSDGARADEIISYLLPHMALYRALQAAGIEDAELAARLDASFDSDLASVLRQQNEDGGWGWYARGRSNPYLSTYILFGLQRAALLFGREDVNDAQMNGYLYLQTALNETPGTGAMDLDSRAFVVYVLTLGGQRDLNTIDALYEQRAQLNPASLAYLALVLREYNDPRLETIVSDLQALAGRTSTGAFWQAAQAQWYLTPATPLYQSAAALYALATLDPASPLAADATRYIASQRNAVRWYLPMERTWTMLALIESLKGTADLTANFAYSATFNTLPFLTGQAGGAQNLTVTSANAPFSSLYTTSPNILEITRGDGAGRLYYTATLNVERPVESAPALNKGLGVVRDYLKCAEKVCTRIESAPNGENVVVRLTVNVPNDVYYLVVEDYIPAGAEIINPALKTSQLINKDENTVRYDADNPYENGWGWWLFASPEIYDDHIIWRADFVPAGTYTLTYTLVPSLVGEYRVIPARAWLYFFPEVQGNSAGTIFGVR
jgi:alpha-2-macroglobulin